MFKPRHASAGTVAVLAAVFVFLAGCATLPQAEKPFHLTIAHLNDHHAHLDGTSLSLKLGQQSTYVTAGGLPRIAAKMKQVRAADDNVLLLHAGDVFTGTLYFNKYKGRADADLMNLIGFEAMTLGNHEFDQGPPVLASFLTSLRFPVLSANTDVSREPVLNGLVRSSMVKEVQGQKIGLIGLTTPETEKISRPGPNVHFQAVAAAAEREVQALTNQGVNKIIAVTHLGLEDDIKLARAVPGLDVIVGGHSHTLLGDFASLGLAPEGPYPVVIDGPGGEKTMIVQSWKWALVLGLIEVDFDLRGVVSGWQGRPLLLVGRDYRQKDQAGCLQPVGPAQAALISETLAGRRSIQVIDVDPAAEAKLAEYRAGIEAMQNEVMGRVKQDLIHRTGSGKASQVAPLVTRAMLDKLRESRPELAFYLTNAGTMRTDLRQGPLTVAQIHELLPFDNTLVIMELTGAQIQAAIESGVKRGGGAWPCLAGARFQAAPGKPGPQGLRIETLGPDSRWTILDEKKVYLVGTHSFVAGGGDGYEVLKTATGARTDTGFIEADVFMEYVARRGTIP
ncbi:MAG: 5'-nucleotidase C-terminal domain-containing protein [Thermodesulfobacteriota bacterium]